MRITFPTAHDSRGALGLPERAEPCRCDHGPLLADGPDETCLSCGHFDELTIAWTWRLRARQLSGGRPVMEQAA